jgi:hypothetical protein
MRGLTSGVVRASRAINGVLQHAVCDRRPARARRVANGVNGGARRVESREKALSSMRCCAVSAEKMRGERASVALSRSRSGTAKSVVNRILSEFDDLVRRHRCGR